MLMLYDLEDNPIRFFDNYKECAEWFGTSVECLYSYISRSRKGITDKKRNLIDHKWYRLIKIEMNDE